MTSDQADMIITQLTALIAALPNIAQILSCVYVAVLCQVALVASIWIVGLPILFQLRRRS